MTYYIVIETEAGLEVAEVSAGKSADDGATAAGGVLIDAGPYKSYEQAKDVMEQLPENEKERARYRE